MRRLRIITLVCFLLSAAALGASTAYQAWSEDKTIPVIDCPETPLVLPSTKKKKDLARELGVSRTTLWRMTKRQEAAGRSSQDDPK